MPGYLKFPLESLEVLTIDGLRQLRLMVDNEIEFRGDEDEDEDFDPADNGNQGS